MSLVEVIAAVFVFFVFSFFLACAIGKELRRAREHRESREAYGLNEPTWKDILR